MWSHFGSFWSVKYLNFRQKLPIWTAHDILLKSRHPEVTKNSYYALSPDGSQKKDYVSLCKGMPLMMSKNILIC